MRATFHRLWQHHRLAVLAFAIAFLMFGFFAVRTVASTIYWMDPAHVDQPLEGWMTPRYVARSYRLPPDVVGPALWLVDTGPPKRMSLERIADQKSVTLAELQARVDAAAAAFRAAKDAQQ